MLRTAFVAVIVIVLTAGAPAVAQQPAPESAAWRALAEALEPGAFISVSFKDGTRVKGTLVQRTPDGILVKPKTRVLVPARELPYSDIDSIERAQQGMSPASKVLIGVGIGLGIFGVLIISALAASN